MKHKHHIIPKYEGGSDFAENLVELTVTQHAMWHFAEWRRKGRWQDKLAWQGLAGIIGHEEAVHKAIVDSKTKENHWIWGTKRSSETKRKIGLGNSGPSKSKSLSKKGDKNPNHGKHWYNNGVESRLEDVCPEGWVKGRLISWKMR